MIGVFVVRGKRERAVDHFQNSFLTLVYDLKDARKTRIPRLKNFSFINLPCPVSLTISVTPRPFTALAISFC